MIPWQVRSLRRVLSCWVDGVAVGKRSKRQLGGWAPWDSVPSLAVAQRGQGGLLGEGRAKRVRIAGKKKKEEPW